MTRLPRLRGFPHLVAAVGFLQIFHLQDLEELPDEFIPGYKLLCIVELIVCHCHFVFSSVCLTIFFVVAVLSPVQGLQSIQSSEDHTGRAWLERAGKHHII